MERLTRRLNNNKIVAIKGDSCNYSAYSFDCQPSEGIKRLRTELEKLADYEDLEEQGLLVRLPCKEAYSKSGDFVYLIYDYEIIECVHCGLEICPVSGEGFILLATDERVFPYRNPDPEHDLDPTDWCTNATDASMNEIGKTLFFTREEAEKKLEEMKNDKA